MNVALYGKPSRWAMTKRGRGALRQSADAIEIGASSMRWDGEALIITIDEIAVPLPSRLRGTVTVRPRAVTSRIFTLDAGGRHRWRPIATMSDIEVSFQHPQSTWRGTGYFDTNNGDEPLEAAFRSWTWSRFDLGDRARIFYDVVQRNGIERSLSLTVDRAGAIEPGQPVGCQSLQDGLWGVKRLSPGALDVATTTLERFVDAPFYTRSKILGRIDGIDAVGLHESLSLRRASAWWVRMLLPFRMPRRAR